MPNILVLKDRETGVRYENRGLIEVDEKLCAALGVPCDDVNFYEGWVDLPALYLNDSWDEVKKTYDDPRYDDSKGWVTRRRQIIDWLAEHYELCTYAQIGRR